MSSLKRSIPSLFHRRLLLLVVLMLGATGVLGAQLFRLTVIDGAHHRSEAEKALSTRKLVTTARGTIYDRKGRILAQDQACFDIAVEYEVISGHWAYVRARKAAYRDYRETWGRMSFDEREAKVVSYRAAFDADLDQLWSTVAQVAGVEPTELERRRATVIRKIQAVRSDVWDRRIRRRAAERQGPVELRSRRVTVAEENEAHALLPAVSDAVAFRFRQMADRLPGVQVIPSRTRRYPLRRLEVEVDRSVMPSPLREPDSIVIDVDRLGGHLMGTVREVHAEHVTARPFRPARGQIDLGGYLPGDMAGRGGVEEAEEQHLRGWRGMRSIRLDTQEKTLAPPRQGRPMELSIDIHLQARIRALLDPKLGLTKVQEWHKNSHLPLGMPLNAAAVVMDVETAELLALVSTPVPPWPGPAAAGENPASDPDRPFVNRTIGSVYPPGSLLKPIVYCIAAQRGAIGSAQEVDCQGHLLPDHPGRYRCWGWRPQEGYFLRHGPLPPVEAIARSCNIFFYTCGRNLGAEALVADLGRWGLGTAVGLGLPGESRGMLPRLSGANRPGRELTLSNATLMGIGQGPVAVPPVQIVAAHAALARGGYYLSPVLIRHRASRQETRDLRIPEAVIHQAQQGMRESAGEAHGTGHHISSLPPTADSPKGEPIINAPNVVVRCKTGTAQAPTQYELVPETDAAGRTRWVRGPQVLRTGSHSWYLAHVLAENSRGGGYVIAVIVEYGGSGGRVSGPIVNQVIHAMQREGYF